MEESRRETLKLNLCVDNFLFPSQTVRLSTTLMSTVLANQKYRSIHHGVSRPVHKIDLQFVSEGSSMSNCPVRSDWSQCLDMLYEYRQDLRKNFGSTVDSVFGTLTIAMTFSDTLRTFLTNETEILELFESVCLRIYPEQQSIVDRLPDLMPQHGLVHLELYRCKVANRDLEKLVLHTQGLKTLTLQDVKMEGDLPMGQTAASIPLLENGDSMPKITLTIPPFYYGEPDLPAYWRVIDALPQIDELHMTTNRKLRMLQIQSKLSRINTPIKRIHLRIADLPGHECCVDIEQLTTFFASMPTLIGFHMKIDIKEYIEADTRFQFERTAHRTLSTWAIAPRCRLTSITLPNDCLPSVVFTIWEECLESQWDEESERADVNTKSQLRRLDFYRYYLGENSSFQLPKLLTFLKTHFPYVYFIGEGARYLADDKEWELRNGSVDTSVVRRQILFQLEQNRVGLTLLDNRVDPPVPLGVWSHILANAVAPPTISKDTSVNTTDQIQWTMKVPWSGIYCLVKELAERELLSDSPLAAAGAAAPIQKGRPWKQQRTI